MLHAAMLAPLAAAPNWFDPATLITAAGAWALLVVCFIIFAETGLLIGFLLPGDMLLIMAGLLANTTDIFGVNIWFMSLMIALAAYVGGECGYLIGHKLGPAVFERKDSGLFSTKNVARTAAFFERYGPLTIIIARFMVIVRTITPVAAGVGHMPWRRYTLYNFVGAMLWGFGLTMLGYVIGFIPGVSEVMLKYVDVILLAAVGGTIIITGSNYIVARRRAKREAATEGGGADTPVTLPPM